MINGVQCYIIVSNKASTIPMASIVCIGITY